MSCLCVTFSPWIAASAQSVAESGAILSNQVGIGGEKGQSTGSASSRCLPVNKQESDQIQEFYSRVCPKFGLSVLQRDRVIEGVQFPNVFGDTTVANALKTFETTNATGLQQKLTRVSSHLRQLLKVSFISFQERCNQLLCMGALSVCEGSPAAALNRSVENNTSSIVPVQACNNVCRDMYGYYSLSTYSNETMVSNSTTVLTDIILRLSRICSIGGSTSSYCVDCGAAHHSLAGHCFASTVRNQSSAKEEIDDTRYGFCPLFTCATPLIPTNVSSRIPRMVQDASIRVSGLRSMLVEIPAASNLLSCGLPCDYSVFSPDSSVKSGQAVITVLSGIALSVSVLACVNFAVNSDVMSRFPTRIVMYVNTCSVLFNLTMFLSSLLALSGMTSTLCYDDDGLLRVDVPRLDPNQMDVSSVCIASAMLLAFFTFATGGWWIALIHGWYRTSQSLANLQLMAGLPRLEISYNIHVWVLSTIATAAFASTGRVSAIPTAGICFSHDSAVLVFFFGFPTIVLTSFTAPMMYIGHQRLKSIWIKLEKKGLECGSVMSPRTVVAHQDTLRRLAIYFVASIVFLCLALVGITLYSVEIPTARSTLVEHFTCIQLSCTPDQCVAPSDVSSMLHLLLPVLSIVVTAFLSGWIFSKSKWIDVKVSARRSVTKISEQLHHRLAFSRVDTPSRTSANAPMSALPKVDFGTACEDSPAALAHPHDLSGPVGNGIERRGVVRFVKGVVNPFVVPLLCNTVPGRNNVGHDQHQLHEQNRQLGQRYLRSVANVHFHEGEGEAAAYIDDFSRSI